MSMRERRMKTYELREKIRDAFLEVWDIPNQPFLDAVEEFMGSDYWDARITRFFDTLDTIQDREVLLNILNRMEELVKLYHIPQRCIGKIDKLVRAGEYSNRSDFVTKAIIEKLEREEAPI